VGAERVAGLEDGGDPGMCLQHHAQPMGQDLELPGPAEGGVEVEVDLGQDAVKE
jgi:hypothetical protein